MTKVLMLGTVHFHITPTTVLSVLQWATGCRADETGLIPGRDKRFSLFSSVQTCSEAHPASYQRIIHWGLSGWDMKLATHFHLVPRSRILELYLHIPIYLHGVVLNQFSTEKT
jgi:hypothetical protein